MSLLNQKTIKNPVSLSGIGLHSGKLAKICVKPSSPDTGIVFKRIDLETNNLVYPNWAKKFDLVGVIGNHTFMKEEK